VELGAFSVSLAVKDLQRQLKARGVVLQNETEILSSLINTSEDGPGAQPRSGEPIALSRSGAQPR
jgi:hypothetical protein